MDTNELNNLKPCLGMWSDLYFTKFGGTLYSVVFGWLVLWLPSVDSSACDAIDTHVVILTIYHWTIMDHRHQKWSE